MLTLPSRFWKLKGEGKLTLHGQYDIEIGATYRITYQSRSRDNAEIVLSVEKIG